MMAPASQVHAGPIMLTYKGQIFTKLKTSKKQTSLNKENIYIIFRHNKIKQSKLFLKKEIKNLQGKLVIGSNSSSSNITMLLTWS